MIFSLIERERSSGPSTYQGVSLIIPPLSFGSGKFGPEAMTFQHTSHRQKQFLTLGMLQLVNRKDFNPFWKNSEEFVVLLSFSFWFSLEPLVSWLENHSAHSQDEWIYDLPVRPRWENMDLLNSIYFNIISGDLKIFILIFHWKNDGNANYSPPLRFREKSPKGGE